MEARVRVAVTGVAVAGLAAAAYFLIRPLVRGKQRQADEPPAELICPITRELMECPVVTADGHTYERHAILTWLETSDMSPRTGKHLPNKTLLPNFSLRAQIEDFRQRNGLAPLPRWLPEALETVTAAPPRTEERVAAMDQMQAVIVAAAGRVLLSAPLLMAQVEFALGQPPGTGLVNPTALAQAAMANQQVHGMVHAAMATALEPALVVFEAIIDLMGNAPPAVIAIRHGDLPGLERLVGTRQVDPKMVLQEGRTLLHIAAFSGQIRVAQFLIAQGVDVNAADMRRATALHLAAFVGHAEMVALLLTHGAQVDARAQGGTTPVHVAAFRGHEELVQGMLEKHNADVMSTRENGIGLLHIAAQAGHRGLVKLLIDKGGQALVQTFDNAGSTPLHCAVQSGSLEVVRMLVDAGVDVLARTQTTGELALHVAAWLGKTDTVRYLLGINCPVNMQRADGCTVLHYAGIRGDVAMATLLLEHSADTSIRRNDGFTALHTACWFKHLEVARVLIEAKSPLEARTSNQSTALHFACWHGNTELVGLLLAAGASIESRTQDGDTALHQAVFNNHAGTTRLLLQRFPDAVVPGPALHSGSAASLSESFINAKKRDGSTALHLAAVRGLHEMVALLLQHGCDRMLLNRGGMRALDLARQHNHAAVVRLLDTA